MTVIAALTQQIDALSIDAWDPYPFSMILEAALPEMPAVLRGVIDLYLQEDITLLFIKSLFRDRITDPAVQQELDAQVAFWGKRVREIDLGSSIFEVRLKVPAESLFFTGRVGRALDQHYPFVTEITHPYGGFTQVGEGREARKKSMRLTRLQDFVGEVRVQRPVYTPTAAGLEPSRRYHVRFNDYPVTGAAACQLLITRTEDPAKPAEVVFETAIQ